MIGLKLNSEFLECKTMSEKKIIKIGNASGYWGDDPFALKRQVENGRLDYITMDFLAEVTMSIMQKQKNKDPHAGYARDFLVQLEDVLPTLLKNKTKIITNAGGINVRECALAVAQLAKKLGLKCKVAAVYGDDILADLDKLNSSFKNGFANMDTDESFDKIRTRVEAANVYFGAWPVVEALKNWDPDIIVTGRVTDTGITLAAMIHEFNWQVNAWDKLASGIVAGHILECGAQSTGGNFTDWHEVEKKGDGFNNIGYPIAEVSDSGEFVITKHAGTGGYVSVDTVREQLFYEMGHPKAYITPDVVADFSTIQLKADGKNRVRVFGVRGFAPTETYKISIAYTDGFKCTGGIIVSGPQARAKAEKFSEIFWKKLDKEKFIAKETEYVGWNSCHRSLAHTEEGVEIFLRFGALASAKEALVRFGKLLPALILSGPPGVAVVGGVPKVQDVVSYWPALMPKHLVTPKIACVENEKILEEKLGSITPTGQFDPKKNEVQKQISDKTSLSVQEYLQSQNDDTLTPLSAIALARSGDKGDTSNIGLIARSAKAYEFLKEQVTAQFVKNAFQELCYGKVTRYEVPNLQGFNFLLDEALGGGGTMSLRIDAQGKTMSHALLRQKFLIPKNILDEIAHQQ